MKKAVRILGAQMRNVDFIQTGFIGRMDFVIVRYSIAATGLWSSNRFSFQGKIVSVSPIYKKYMKYLCA
jgi:hypothetical protein